MAAPKSAPLACDAAWLRRTLAQTLRASNRALQAPPAAAAPPVHYRSGGQLHALPGQLFQQPYTLRLDTLELTLHGYHLARHSGWERRLETCFSTRRPPLWQRLLRPPPLFTLTIQVRADAIHVALRAAPRGSTASAPMLVRLDADLQQQLSNLQQQARAERRLAERLRGWLQRRQR